MATFRERAAHSVDHLNRVFAVPKKIDQVFKKFKPSECEESLNG